MMIHPPVEGALYYSARFYPIQMQVPGSFGVDIKLPWSALPS